MALVGQELLESSNIRELPLILVEALGLIINIKGITIKSEEIVAVIKWIC